MAIPAQAVIVPLYLLIGKMGLYDTLPAIILPTAAFAMPVAVLVLSGTMRDVSEEMYEAMALDGASPLRMLWQLAIPHVQGRHQHGGDLHGAPGVERLPLPADPDPVRGAPAC